MSEAIFQAGQSTLRPFRTAVEIVQRLVSKRKIRLRISGTGAVTLKVDDPALREELAQAKFTHEDFSKILDNEITQIMNTVVTENENQYLRYMSSPESNAQLKTLTKEEIEKFQEALREKLTVVKASLITKELSARAAIKKTSKHDKLSSYSWEIVEKLSDKNVGKLSPHPYVTLIFTTSRRGVETPEFMKWLSYMGFGFTEPTDSMSFDLDTEDLDAIIEELTAARRALAEVTGKEEAR